MVDKCTAIAQMVAKNREMVNQNSTPVQPKNSLYARYIKRVIDLIIVIPAFLILLPINMIIGIVTFFDVGVPIFFIQKRTGKDGKQFNLINVFAELFRNALCNKVPNIAF